MKYRNRYSIKRWHNKGYNYNRSRRWARHSRYLTICPICKLPYNNTDRCRIRYHVSYKYDCLIFACSSCNTIEYRLRRGYILNSYEQTIAERIKTTGLTYFNDVRKSQKQSKGQQGYWIEFHTPFGMLRKWRHNQTNVSDLAKK
jgi:hypothetical protein